MGNFIEDGATVVGGSQEHEPLLGDVARGVLESLFEGCALVGLDDRFSFVNDAFAKQVHRSRHELIGRIIGECFPGTGGAAVWRCLHRCMTERTPERLAAELKLADETAAWFDMRFVPSPRGVCVLLLDTTSERRSAEVLARTEEQLRHAQEMEAIGRVAGGVAHELNNALSVILCSAELILEELEPNHALREDLEQIRAAGQRAVALTRQLLAFSRQTTTQPQLLDVNEVVAGTEKVLGRLLGTDISLTMSRASSVWPVKADPGRLVQAVLNLAVNARDAMPMGGTLAIETKNIELDEEHARNHPGVVPGQYVMIAVTDNGIGMDEATRARAFEPFFTTKDNGKGTGLGLSIVCGTMRQVGGHIRLDSEIGKGSRFELYFPRAVDAPVPRSCVPLAPLPERGTETMLVVEEDEQVRAVAAGDVRRRVSRAGSLERG